MICNLTPDQYPVWYSVDKEAKQYYWERLVNAHEEDDESEKLVKEQI